MIVQEEQRDAHMAKVRARMAECVEPERREAMEASVEAFMKPVAATRSRMLDQVARSASRTKALMWLRREAGVLSNAASKGSACSRGCSACCHINVEVTEAEAKFIGSAIGRAPHHQPAGAVQVPRDPRREDLPVVDQQAHFGVPCTFLRENECSIWEHRPLACRWQFNVDRDALLCQLVPGEVVHVPYLDTSAEKTYMVAKVGLGGRMADIRAWFPEAA